MKFQACALRGVFVVELEMVADERGFFARSWCQKEFQEQGLVSQLLQCSISFNKKKGTLRGLHYQAKPYEETKLVRCTMGALYDVLIDLRPDSPTYKQWMAVELSAQNRRMLYIPAGFAHGFQTLEDDTEVFYQISEFYQPDYAQGIRWDDAMFKIHWPEEICSISDKDKHYPDFKP